MQKVKFIIKGMESPADAAEIENKLKELSGVTMSKVNYESTKAVVIYDENKAEELDFKKLVNKLHNFQVSDISQSEGKPKVDAQLNNNLEVQQKSFLNNSLLLGIFVGISAMSITINVILLILLT